MAQKKTTANLTEAPVLTVVPAIAKAKAEPKFDVITVKVMRGLVFDAAGILKDAATSGKVENTVFPYAVKTLKSGRVTVTIGKVAAGRPKLSDTEKAERKAAVKSFRKLMTTSPDVAKKLETLTPEQIKAILGI